MEDNRRISLCIPTWNRFEQTIESFMDVYADPRIGEIIIVDDASDLSIFHQLREVTEKFEKIKLYRNVSNFDCYRNKYTCISFAKYPFAILLDSDNHIDKSYIDRLYEIQIWKNKFFYTPCFAYPHFDFRAYSGMVFTKENAHEFVDKPMWETMLNAANFFVNREAYLQAFDDSIDPVTSDSILISYNHLKNGGCIYCVDGLQYEHTVHSGSHYQNNVHRTPNGFHQNILNSLRQLS